MKKGQGIGDKGQVAADPLRVLQEELQAMVKRVQARGVEIFLMTTVSIVPDDAGNWLIKSTSVGVDGGFCEGMRRRCRAAVDETAAELGYVDADTPPSAVVTESLTEAVQ